MTPTSTATPAKRDPKVLAVVEVGEAVGVDLAGERDRADGPQLDRRIRPEIGDVDDQRSPLQPRVRDRRPGMEQRGGLDHDHVCGPRRPHGRQPPGRSRA